MINVKFEDKGGKITSLTAPPQIRSQTRSNIMFYECFTERQTVPLHKINITRKGNTLEILKIRLCFYQTCEQMCPQNVG